LDTNELGAIYDIRAPITPTKQSLIQSAKDMVMDLNEVNIVEIIDNLQTLNNSPTLELK
jgi:hypothetical protein